MSITNNVTLIGNVGADPECKTFSNGTEIVNLRLATSRKWKDKAGVVQEKTNWHAIQVYGATVSFVKNYVKKGDKIAISGSLEYNEYTNSQDVKVTFAYISCNDVQIMKSAESRQSPHGATEQKFSENTSYRAKRPDNVPTNNMADNNAFDDDVPF